MLKLNVSESFFSIQGEGPTAGTPAVFLRLAKCNLTCGGLNTVKSRKIEPGATWRCDTIEVWMKGVSQSFEDIIESWDQHGFLDQLRQGAHLVVTGGEPLLQMEALVSFLICLDHVLEEAVFVEVETNGTLAPNIDLLSRVNQFNVSPKLANSGMSFKKRVLEHSINRLNEHTQTFFKFVITDEADVVECMQTFVEPMGIPARKIIFMPGGETREKLEKLSPLVKQKAKEKGAQFSTRLQIILWDQTVGV